MTEQTPTVFTRPRMINDFETRSELNIKDVGVWRYAEHPSTEVLFLSYGLVGKSKKLWTPDQPFPSEITDHIESGGVIEAHNAMFEMAIWLCVLHRRMGLPMPRRWLDTMATCAYRALPLGLDDVGSVLDLEVQKDRRGSYLIQRLCKPRKPLKHERRALEDLGLKPDEWPTLWVEDDQLMRELGDYCVRDSDVEDALGETVGDLPPGEYKVWALDQQINRRGIHLDVEAVRSMLAITDDIEERLTAELTEITDGQVTTAGQRDRILAWLENRKFPIADLTADTVKSELDRLRRHVKDNVDKDHDLVGGYSEEIRPVVRLLEIRQALSKSSTKKLRRALQCVCDDGKLRGLLQYHGAGTGRWAGRLVQPQNFPRGVLEDYAKLLDTEPDVTMELLIDVIKARDAGLLEDIFGDPMTAVSTALRGMFVAEPGHELSVADFSAIEAVGTSWIAGEEWKLDAFRAIQRGEGYRGSADIYCATASMVFQYHVQDKKSHPKERGVGKVCLAGNTSVITDRGVKMLHSITKDDMLWDGLNWVTHDSVVCNGEREVIDLCGTWLTPNHEILTPKGWREARTVASSRNILLSALEIGSESWRSLALSPGTGCSASAPVAIRRTRSIRGMSRGTFGSARDGRMLPTSGRSVIYNDAYANSKRRTLVYDVLNAGPRRRFTILTDRGPLVVSNCELAFGYQGGVGAWRNFDDSDTYTDEEVDFYKKQWRAEHPMTCELWYGLERAAVSAVQTGRPHSYRGILYSVGKDRAGRWLMCRLPSGRLLWYYDPWLVDAPTSWDPNKKQIVYQGRDNKRGGAWGLVRTYGGMLTENVVQGWARDVMVESMFRVERAGYPIVLTVHDEIVSQTPVDFGSIEEYERLMAVNPTWAEGCPIAVDGWRGTRYHK